MLAMTRITSPYRPEIDGLRAVAVLAVILFHAGFRAFSGGFAGVDVFFVISGYLITSVILTELESGRFRLGYFLERRARRILPALLLTAALCVPIAWFLLPPRDMQNFAQSLVAVPLFASNILFWREGGYFEPASELKPLLHTWSLSVEEQFYLLYPALLLLVWRLSRRSIPGVLVAATLSSFMAAEIFTRVSASATFFLLPFRAWELATGSLVAVAMAQGHHDRFNRSAREFGGAAGLFLITAGIIGYDSKTPFPGAPALVPVLGAALILFFTDTRTTIGKLLSIPALIRIGLASYSAYLIHHPLLVFARYKFGLELNTAILLVICATSLGLAIASWRYVELPFRKPGNVSRSKFIALSVTSSAILIGIGLLGHKTDGHLFQRLSPDRAAVVRSAAVSPMRAECHTGGSDYRPVKNACLLSEGKWKIATFGDSHTVELAYSLSQRLRPKNVGLIQLSFSNCNPAESKVASSTRDSCATWSEEAISRIIDDESIRIVVISYRIVEYLRAAQARDSGAPAGSVEHGRDKLWKTYLGIINRLLRHGKKVIVVLQAPELREDIQSLIFKSDRGRSDIVGSERRWWEDKRRFLRERLPELPRQAIVVDPTNVFCDEISCHAVRNGKALYFDDHHIALPGADLLADQIMPLLEFDTPPR
jgi:peptidoglycan/LPS O-acetylase OafA/YrhL